MKINRTASADALVGIYNVLLTAMIICCLYFAREILIPFALAALLAFLFSPVVTRMERWLGRVGAVLIVVFLLFAAIGVAGWTLTHQVVDLAAKLPEYQTNIQHKLRAMKIPLGGTFDRFFHTMDELKKELPDISKQSMDHSIAAGHGTSEVIPVKIVASPAQIPTELMHMVIAVVLGPLGTTGIVLLLLVFMLLYRQDLRGRFLRLAGQANISATTQAMDDAGTRVSRYLFMQFIVNTAFAALISTGLFFIGVPNAVLWGVLAGVFRFIPYVGPWIGAATPLALSIAVSNTWVAPLSTLALFLVLELVNANAIEPWLYGSSTSVSSMALIVAAIFWSWLWGPVGLVLSTPLTVCLAVMGRHVRRLEFLSVLLSEEQALAPHEECYHRLLAFGLNEAGDFVESYLKENSLTNLYDSVLIPVIMAAESDFLRGSLDQEHRSSVHQGVREIIEDLDSIPVKRDGSPDGPTEETASVPQIPMCRILCLPVRAERDELACMMLAQLVHHRGCEATVCSGKLTTSELVEAAEKSAPDIISICVVSPSTLIHARYLCGKLRKRVPKVKIIVATWGKVEHLITAEQRLRDSGASEVVGSLADVVTVCTQSSPSASGDSYEEQTKTGNTSGPTCTHE